jgi:hypothetical protein
MNNPTENIPCFIYKKEHGVIVICVNFGFRGITIPIHIFGTAEISDGGEVINTNNFRFIDFCECAGEHRIKGKPFLVSPKVVEKIENEPGFKNFLKDLGYSFSPSGVNLNS